MNDGPDAVTIAQVTVDDAYWSFTSERGPARAPGADAHSRAVSVGRRRSAPRQDPDVDRARRSSTRSRSRSKRRARPRAILAAFALIGLYVGVLPVALGLCWFPVLARLGRRGLDVLLAVTIGLLAFLFVDAVQEGFEGASEMAGAFQGTALFVGAAAVAYLGLEVVGQWLRARARPPQGRRLQRRIRARAAHRDRHRPPQLRRRPGDRRRLRARRGGARHAAHRRLHAAQHHRGARDPRADREGASRRSGCSSSSG